jgi:hypothetical protein
MIIETCPKCGHDLQDIVICTYPPIPKKECWNCGWSWTGEADKVTRVPFNPDTENSDSDWIKDTEGDKLNLTDVCTLAKEPPITLYDDNCLASFPNKNADAIYNKAFNNEACKNCSNNPANGGSGICNCTLGQMPVTC